MSKTKITELLGKDAESLLTHKSKTISKSQLHLPGPDFVDKIFCQSNRSTQTLRNLQTLFDNGRLGKTGFLSILPIDQGIEHSAGASFAKNPIYFDPENIIKLAIEGGCNAVATTYGGLAIMSRKNAHKNPFFLYINHKELITYSNQAYRIMICYLHD